MRQGRTRYDVGVKPWHVFVAGFAGMALGAVAMWVVADREVDRLRDPGRRMQQLEDQLGLPQWWCDENRCTRDKVCTIADRRRCEQRRVAWCAGGRDADCFVTLADCERLGARGAVCLGVQ